jgi:hypothetical protein
MLQDDHLILEPEDFMMPRKHSNTETTPVGKKQHSQPLFGSSRPHTDDDGEGKDEEGIIYVQGKISVALCKSFKSPRSRKIPSNYN